MYAMPNLVAGSRIVPELIQDDFTPQRVADEAVALLTDGERRARMTEALRQVKARLGTSGASSRAADAVLEVVSGVRSA
jgi:lipid-A-disaccharide synthase